jgi:hypothetical protein
LRVVLGLTGAEEGSTGSVFDANEDVGGEMGLVRVPGTTTIKESCA